MDFSTFTQIQLSEDTDIKPFRCADADLNGFLFDDAKHFHKELMAVTYLIEDPAQQVTAAYFSLLADKIIFSSDDKPTWNRLNRNIPNPKRRKSYPAVKIGRLAVHDDYARCGMGTFILDSIKYAFTTVKRLGCRFITVDALSSATDFYLKNGFMFFTDGDCTEATRLMFFDLRNFCE